MEPMHTPRDRRSAERFFYTKDQLLRRAPIHLRRRRDKERLVGHLGLAAALVGLSVWWVIPLHDFAGPVLVALTPSHGVHVGDLPTLVFLAVAGRSLVAAARLRGLTAVGLRATGAATGHSERGQRDRSS